MSRRSRAVKHGRSILALDVLGEIRRAMRILRRAEKFLAQEERRAKARKATLDRARKALKAGAARTVDEALELAEQS